MLKVHNPVEKSSTDRAGAEPCTVELVRDECISEQRIVAIVVRGHLECNGDGQPVRMRGVMDKLVSQ